MSRSLSLAILTFIAIAFLAGCGKQETKIVGLWSGTALAKSRNGNGDTDQQTERITYFLKLKDDKTFSEGLHSDYVEGTWTLKENTITLNPTIVNGTKVDSFKQQLRASARENEIATIPGLNGPEQGTVSEDGETITIVALGATFDLHPIQDPTGPTQD